MKTCLPWLGVSAMLLLASNTARAVEPLDTFSARIGGYVTTFDTKLRADGETEAGTEIDLDRDLGLDNNDTIGFIGFTWRPWEHHEFALNYYQDDADATRTLQRDIVFEDTTYTTSSTVRAGVDLDGYEASYVWWAASHDTWALGPRFGLIWYKLSMNLSLEVDANGNPIGGAISNEVSADLPAPTIGGSFRWTPHEQWRFSADLGYFSTDVNDVDGDVTYGKVGVEWYPWERVGFALDYTVARIDVDVAKTRFDGNLEFVESGVRLGVVYRF